MLPIRFHPVSGPALDALRAGGPDANGQPAERATSDGSGIPCRCCLGLVPAGRPYLIAGWRPFDTLHPYAETGPVFFCADCTPAVPAADLPQMFTSPSYIVRGYDASGRIVYGTGGVVPRDRIAPRAAELLARADIAHVDVRSAANNCYHARIRRA
jgi:hypothetical protein